MIDWIKRLFGSTDDETPSGVVDKALLFRLRKELKACEALYRDGAILCGRVCQERIGSHPEKFAERMLDLHRQLLVKILIEIARGDRQWNPAEREVAFALLHHVWGPDVAEDILAQRLRNIVEHAEWLVWENLLTPFVEMPPLAEQAAELNSHVMRIANLIAKADGIVLPSEAKALKSIQSSIEHVLDRADKSAKKSRLEATPRGQDVAPFGKLEETQAPGGVALDQFFAADGERAIDAPSRHVRTTAGVDTGKGQRSRDETLAQALEELDQLIGIEFIKKDIRELVNFLKIQEQRERHGLARTQVSLHTVLLGNPGTGKTTVARILGRIFGGLGILEKGHAVETDRSGLVAEYLGQTGPRVNKRVDQALDGVLFIDEAYSMVAEHRDDSYGAEAVQVLLKRMEDDGKRLVVVLAGYPQPMDRMLRSNPGIASRFQRTFDFPDYTADELVEIFQRMCAKNDYALLEAAREKLRAGFQSLIDRRDERFGNGRLARNVFEKAIRCMATRIIEIAPLTRELLSRLLADDIHVEGPSAGR